MRLNLDFKPRSLLRQLGLVAIFAAFFNAGAMAVEDGDIDPKASKGKMDVRLTIPDTIRFIIEVNFDKEQTSPSGDIVRETDACIYFNGGGSYSIIATTDNNDFKLKKTDNGEDVGFAAYWSSTLGREGRQPLQYGKALTGLTIDNSETEDCLSGKGRGNSNFSIQIPRSSVGKVRTGSYSSTISVVISPE